MVANFLDRNNRGPANMAEKNEKIDMTCMTHTQEQKDSPYNCSIVPQCNKPSLSRKIVKI